MENSAYKICSTCIMDTSDPDITFDAGSVCNHCNSYKTYNSGRLKGEYAKTALRQMVEEIKKNAYGNTYDCIMGLSGGVDSSYLAFYAVKNLGLKPLIVHVDSGWNSELAVSNIENIVKVLGLDLHTLVLNWNEIRDLQRAFFKASVPNCDIPQDHAYFAGLYKEASKYKIKSILNGGNMATESILPKRWGYSNSDLIHIKDIHKRFGSVKLTSYPTVNFWEKTFKFPYINRIKVYRPLELINYNKHAAKSLLIKELGWRDYGGKHYESVFTKFFQAYYLPTKFGFDKRRAHLSSLIVSAQITRSEGLEEMKEALYADSQELENELIYFIKKLGFSRSEWIKIMEMPRKTHEEYDTEIKLNNFVQDIVFKPAFKMKSFLYKK